MRPREGAFFSCRRDASGALASSPRRRARVDENAETRRSPGTARAEVARRGKRARVRRVGSRARVSGASAREGGGSRRWTTARRVSPCHRHRGRAEAASVAPRRETQRVLFRGAVAPEPRGHEPELHRLQLSLRGRLGERLFVRGDEAAVPEVRARALEDGEVSPLEEPEDALQHVVVQLQEQAPRLVLAARSRERVLAARQRAALDGRRLLRGDRGRGVRQHPPGAVDERSHGRRGSGRRWRGRAPPSRKPRGRIIFARRPRQQRSAHDVES